MLFSLVFGDENMYGKEKKQSTLLDSEIRYRRLFEAARDGILILDADTGKIEDINPFLLNLLGYSREDLIGKNLWEIGLFKDIDASKKAFLKLQSEKYIRYEDLPLLTTKGRIINVEFVSNVYLVENHHVIQCNIRDITDRKRVEEDLKVHTEEIDDLYNNAPCGYHSLDNNGSFVRINNTELLWIGYSREEIINKMKLSDILTPESQKIFEENFRELKRRGFLKNQKLEIIGKEGKIIPVLIDSSAIYDTSGNFIMSRSSVFDITNLKRAETALEAANVLLEQKIKERTAQLAKINEKLLSEISERRQIEKILEEKQERLEIAQESAKIGAFEWNIQMDVIHWSSKIESLFGFPPGGLEKNYAGWIKLIHPADAGEVEDEIRKSLHMGEYLQDFRVIWPDGSIHWLQSRARIYFDLEGKPLRMIGVNVDITPFKELEIEKEQLRSDLTHVTRVMMLSELSASLAHELNQPLGAIATNAYSVKLLLSRQPPEVDLKEAILILSDIIADNKRAGDFIQKLRGLVKKAELSFEPLNMNNLIQDAVILLNSNIIISRISLKLLLEPNLPEIRGDQVHLKQVLLNLISNALHAMQATTEKTLTIQTEILEKSFIVVSITDSGEGIDDKYQTEIFRSFFSTKDNGLGMGLPICRSIIEFHGGILWNEKNPSGGTRFCFTLEIWKEV